MVAIRVDSREDAPVKLVPHGCNRRVGAREQLIYKVRRRCRGYPFSCVNAYKENELKHFEVNDPPNIARGT